MGKFWKFQIIFIPIMFVSGVGMMLIDGRLFETWANVSFFIWNWLSCYFITPGLEKSFHKYDNQEDLWTKLKTNIRHF